MKNRLSCPYVVAAVMIVVLWAKAADAGPCARAWPYKTNYGSGEITIWYIEYYWPVTCPASSPLDPPSEEDWEVTNYLWGVTYNTTYKELSYIEPGHSITYNPNVAGARGDFNSTEKAFLNAVVANQWPALVDPLTATQLAQPTAVYNCYASLYGKETLWIDSWILIMGNYSQVSSAWSPGAIHATHGWVGMDIAPSGHGTAKLVSISYILQTCPPQPVTVTGYEGKYGFSGKYRSTLQGPEQYASMGVTRYHKLNPAAQ